MDKQIPLDDDVICRERIRPRKMKSQNIVHRLRHREHFGNKTSINHQNFYQCLFPNLTVSSSNRKLDGLNNKRTSIAGRQH